MLRELCIKGKFVIYFNCLDRVWAGKKIILRINIIIILRINIRVTIWVFDSAGIVS